MTMIIGVVLHYIFAMFFQHAGNILSNIKFISFICLTMKAVKKRKILSDLINKEKNKNKYFIK